MHRQKGVETLPLFVGKYPYLSLEFFVKKEYTKICANIRQYACKIESEYHKEDYYE